MMNALNERAPAAGNSRGARKSAGEARFHVQDASARPLLQRLECVRKTGAGWIARCPAHDDRRPSLSVAEADDGRVLLRCFAGCSAADVVHSVGLDLADLFPRRLDTHPSGEARRKLAMETRIARQWAALGAILPELAVVEVAAAQVARGEPLSAADAHRIEAAHDRIHRARMAVQEAIR